MFTLSEIIERIKAETPVFWRRVQTFMLTLLLTAMIVQTMDNLPEIVYTVCNYIITASASIVGASQLTKK